MQLGPSAKVTLLAGLTAPSRLGVPDRNQVAKVVSGTVQEGMASAGSVCARAGAKEIGARVKQTAMPLKERSRSVVLGIFLPP
jgi:hypothetical protein